MVIALLVSRWFALKLLRFCLYRFAQCERLGAVQCEPPEYLRTLQPQEDTRYPIYHPVADLVVIDDLCAYLAELTRSLACLRIKQG